MEAGEEESLRRQSAKKVTERFNGAPVAADSEFADINLPLRKRRSRWGKIHKHPEGYL